ncbi:MAG: T9SS type A sorting domain-containing protein, partial [Candidatus Cloacimonetes bacterium]|nr:T9SS type A sorting domain-containing protein [Candidatus Cloacimonadota bacterium]
QKELVSESGVVAFIEFDIIGEVGSKSEVYFTKFDLNETEASGGLQVVSEGKEVTTKRLEVNVRQNLPEKFAFYQNYPNPFSTNTLIRYDLPEDVHVNIQIYNVKGQLIEELFNGVESAGRKKIEWNVLEKSGMSSGIYFYKLSTKDKTFIKKMILMR